MTLRQEVIEYINFISEEKLAILKPIMQHLVGEDLSLDQATDMLLSKLKASEERAEKEGWLSVEQLRENLAERLAIARD